MERSTKLSVVIPNDWAALQHTSASIMGFLPSVDRRTTICVSLSTMNGHAFAEFVRAVPGRSAMTNEIKNSKFKRIDCRPLNQVPQSPKNKTQKQWPNGSSENVPKPYPNSSPDAISTSESPWFSRKTSNSLVTTMATLLFKAHGAFPINIKKRASNHQAGLLSYHQRYGE